MTTYSQEVMALRKTFIIGLIIILVVGGLFAASRARKPKAPQPTTQQVWAKNGIPVETAVISRGDMEQTVEVTGDINALDRVALSAKIPGRVAQVMVREGDRVARGQVVVVLDQQDMQSNLQTARGGLETAVARLSQAKTSETVTKIQTESAIQQAKAQLKAAQARLKVAKNPARSQEKMVAENAVASAKANLDAAESNYKRNAKLLKDGAISQSTYEVVESNYKIAQASYKSAKDQLSMIEEGGRTEDVGQAQALVDVARENLRSAQANASQNLLRKEDVRQAQAGLSQAKAAVALAQQQLSYCYVKSPISGVVSSRSAEPGTVAAAGQPLAEVVNLNSIYFKGDVSERAFANVHTGQKVRVTIDAIPRHTFEGTVAEVYPAGSTSSRNFPVRIAIREGSSRVRPGMFARGHIVTGISVNTMLVPKDAVDNRKGTTMVFTLGSGKKAKQHIVNVLRENRDYVELETPTTLMPGNTVITSGRQNLQDGSKVLVSNGRVN